MQVPNAYEPAVRTEDNGCHTMRNVMAHPTVARVVALFNMDTGTQHSAENICDDVALFDAVAAFAKEHDRVQRYVKQTGKAAHLIFTIGRDLIAQRTRLLKQKDVLHAEECLDVVLDSEPLVRPYRTGAMNTTANTEADSSSHL